MCAALLILLLPLQSAPVLAKKPVRCKPLEFEIRIPQGCKTSFESGVYRVRAGEIELDITRELLFTDWKTYTQKWKSGITARANQPRFKNTRVGPYKATYAIWPATEGPSKRIESHAVLASDVEMVFCITVRAPGEAEHARVVREILSSFSILAKPAALGLQAESTPVREAGTIRLPDGFKKVKRSPRPLGTRGGYSLSTYHAKMISAAELSSRTGPPKLIGSVMLTSIKAEQRLFTGGDTGNPEDTNEFMVVYLAVGEGKFIGKPRRQGKTFGGLKGSLFTARYRDSSGELQCVGLWSGKSKGVSRCPVVLMIIHEREFKLHKKYFSTVLKSFKPVKE